LSLRVSQKEIREKLSLVLGKLQQALKTVVWSGKYRGGKKSIRQKKCKAMGMLKTWRGVGGARGESLF